MGLGGEEMEWLRKAPAMREYCSGRGNDLSFWRLDWEERGTETAVGLAVLSSVGGVETGIV